MKTYPRIVATLMAICLIALSCKKDKTRLQNPNIYGSWQELGTAEVQHQHKSVNPYEDNAHTSIIWTFKPDKTGTQAIYYTDTGHHSVPPGVIRFVWFFQNNSREIFISRVYNPLPVYSSQRFYIHSLTSTHLITKPMDSKNPGKVAGLVVMK